MLRSYSKKGSNKPLVFKKWARKSYSVYRSLHTEVVISVLALAYLISCPVITLGAEEDTTGVKMNYKLHEIEVSAQRSPMLYSKIARIVSVISAKEIEAAPVVSINELLEYVSGVDVRQRGSDEVQADVSIRGGTFDQVLVLINGINITDPQTGHHSFNLPLSITQIERIEILEGPSARVYGPNAFSGAINIITKKPKSNSLFLSLKTGIFSYLNPTFSVDFISGKISQSLSLNYKSSDGYIENTDFKVSNLFYSANLVHEQGRLHFQVGATEKGFGANSFYTPKYPNQFEETKTFFTSLKWESNSKLHLSPSLYLRNHYDRFELFRENPPAWYSSHNYHFTNVYGANLNSWIRWRPGTIAFGADFRSENIFSNVLGIKMDHPRKVNGEDAFYTKNKSRNFVSFYAEQVIYLKNFILTGGFLLNHISQSNLGLKIYPGAEISYIFSPKFKLFGSYNSALRMPTFTDLYYAGPTNIGNPDLKPEKSYMFESGIKLSESAWIGHWVVFYKNGRDIIDWVKKTSSDKWQPQNLTRLNTFGTEMQIEYRPLKKLAKFMPEVVKISYMYLHLKKENKDYISNYVLDNLKNKLNFSINKNLLKFLEMNVQITYQEREGTYTSFENGQWGIETSYKPFVLSDFKLMYKKKNISLFGTVNNVFNVRYYDIGNVLQPGIILKAGLNYTFSFQ